MMQTRPSAVQALNDIFGAMREAVEEIGYTPTNARRPVAIPKIAPPAPVYVLTCTPAIHSALVDLIKAEVAKMLKNRMRWDISRCPTFEVFCERTMKQQANELVIFQKLVPLEDFNDFMNTFLSDYTETRENYERSTLNATCGVSTKLRAVEPF
jgi:hypothetical protein